ncbi:MAG: type II toxin-antitoxin system VapC family toxin [Saprospiraceae bacterium]|nr:type II toxin-antitoxin system VapC family toxin [Saprospiraceae bacterium]
MIVVDANVLLYLWLPGYADKYSQMLLTTDPDWIAPSIWILEVQNVLITHFKQKLISKKEVIWLYSEIENQMLGRTKLVLSSKVLELGLSSGCSSYDCEYVCLAKELEIPLIRNDKKLIQTFPDFVYSPGAFLGLEKH